MEGRLGIRENWTQFSPLVLINACVGSMMIGEGLILSLTGVAIGLVGAWWLGRAGSSLLFGVTSGDPLTFTAVSLLLTVVALAACYFPARRAMKVDPVLALRPT